MIPEIIATCGKDKLWAISVSDKGLLVGVGESYGDVKETIPLPMALKWNPYWEYTPKWTKEIQDKESIYILPFWAKKNNQNTAIQKANYDPDQPRDDSGKWTSGGPSGKEGGKNKELYNYHKEQLKDLTPEQINTLVRKKNKHINAVIHDWQISSTSGGAHLLKEACRKYEGIGKDFNRLPREIIDKSLQEHKDPLAIIALARSIGIDKVTKPIYGEGSTHSLISLDDMEVGYNKVTKLLTAGTITESIITDNYKANIKNSLKFAIEEKYFDAQTTLNLGKPTTTTGAAEYNEAKKLIQAVDRFTKSSSVIEEGLNTTLPATRYAQLKAAGQIIMEKQNYPDEVKLLRGLTHTFTQKECIAIYNAVSKGDMDFKIRIPTDTLASYTTLRQTAHTFATTYGDDYDKLGLVIIRDVPKKDILVPSKLIQYNEGIEKEHIVIHRSPLTEVPLKSVRLPIFRELNEHYHKDYDIKPSKNNPFPLEGTETAEQRLAISNYDLRVRENNKNLAESVIEAGHYNLDSKDYTPAPKKYAGAKPDDESWLKENATYKEF